MKHWHRIKIPFILVGLAFFLRVLNLDFQSFWIDEVQAYYFVEGSFMETVHLIISPEHNGPLYYLLLWVWRQFVGSSDFALRYFSVLCSVLTIPLIWQVTRAWFGRRAAGLSALLMTIAPFAIWFAQENKMYALHMLLTSLATFLLIKAQKYNTWRYWLAYGITMNLLAYSHYFGAFAIAAQGILMLLTNLKSWKVLRSYIITMVIVGVVYLPILQFALRILPHFQLQDISKGFVALPDMLREIAAKYVLRTSMLKVTHSTRLLLPLATLLIFGLITAWWRGWKRGLWMTGLMLFPIGIFYVVSFWVPVFSPKYLSATFPFFIITLAMALEGLGRIWKPLLWAGLALMVSVAGWTNIRILTNPEFQRSDWKATANYLESHAQSNDAIVAFADYISRPINRYYDGPAPVYRFKANAYYPEDYYRDWLQRDNDHHILWLVLHQDQAMAPNNRMKEGAGVLYPNITGLYPNNGQIAILGYNLRWWHTTLPQSATPIDARFENGLALVGYHVDKTSLPPTENSMHPPSNWIQITTYWQLWDDAPPLDFTPFVHMIDAQGGVWGGELQRPPTVFHFTPPENWNASDIIEAHYDVNLNPITPPGMYTLIVGLEREGGERVLLVDGAAEVVLRDVEITN